MAATAITTNTVRAIAAVNGPVRVLTHVCTNCNGNEFIMEEEKIDNENGKLLGQCSARQQG